ncbi:hypothetical protein [Noviherbaspirillum pedocola]|uniref:Antitoxin Xre/MbcA/ParS-like toxin-binding domain-containing protein n=1 Tax=Noviherbaspirillum pedocola TaxID=2801341 RepID=A0A934W7Z3_9BURK|nr:hypothetical protein [Noviherbaspirillum pedocola]MBK4736198.1 hypothetical protein [Noviherbaspirillum pedocola]
MASASTYPAGETAPTHKRQEAADLSAKLSRASVSMGLTAMTVGALLNLQNSVAARVLTGEFQLRRSEEERWKRSTLLVELFDALRLKFPEDTLMRQWLSTHNTAIDDAPVGWIETPTRLEKLIAYVVTGRPPQL